VTSSFLVPWLRLGTHCWRGSASKRFDGRQELPHSNDSWRQSLRDSAFPGRAWERVALLLLLIIFIAGCGIPTSTKPETAPTKSKSTVELGPVKLTAEIEPAVARLSDNPILTVSIEFEEGVEIDKPLFGDALGDFKILDIQEPLPKTREGREIVRQIVTLEPSAAEKFTLDPIEATFRDKRPAGDGQTQSLATKPLAVEIVSAYAKEKPSLGDLREPSAPVALPWRIPIWAWAIGFAALALAVVGLVLYRRERKEKALFAHVLSPEELARLELKKLAASGVMETDVKAFYVDLTAIVRRFIERTTGIRAPEQTTEEFLREISRCSSPRPLAGTTKWSGQGVRAIVGSNQIKGSGATAGLPSSARIIGSPSTAGQASSGTPISPSALKEFLESADLVKFAAHRPRREDIEESLRRAEIFLGIDSRATKTETKEVLA
jgi:hypothetical protein